MTDVITRECKATGQKTRVPIKMFVDLAEKNFGDFAFAAIKQATEGQPLETLFAIYRIEKLQPGTE